MESEDKMKTVLWTVDFSNGMRMYVSASTISVAIKNAVWGYNRDSGALKITAKDITKVQKGNKEFEIFYRK